MTTRVSRPKTRSSERATPSPRAEGGWIVSGAFDLLFLANLAWPLLLLPGLADDHGTGVDFCQLYFLTTPHRWLTLLLVAFDPDRRDGRPGRFILWAALLGVLVVGAYLTTGEFLCLALVDAAWNGWHFASQHAG